MAVVGDRVEVLSKAATRQGVVTRVSGALVTVEWDTGGSTTVIPAPGVMSVIGSRRKARLIFSQFVEEKIATEEQLAQVVCPVGLPIEAHSVPEIAVSIMAQFIQKRAEKIKK